MATSPIDIIKKHLDERAKSDPQFAANYSKEGKNIKDCYAYIISIARKKASGNVCCMSDDEVFGLAVHYYDEDNLDMKDAAKEKKATDVKVAASDDSGSAKKKASKKKPKPAATASEPQPSAKKPKSKKEAKPERQFVQLSIFDLENV